MGLQKRIKVNKSREGNMSKNRRLFELIIILLLFNIIFAANNKQVVNIFDEDGIHFGDESKYETDSIEVEENGRIIARTLELPEYQQPVKITAHLVVKSYLHPSLTDGEKGDEWDRAGSIYLSSPGMENIELLKFITGFGGKSELKNDVTNLAPLLQGKTTIKAFIDTWVSPGWEVDFDLIYTPVDTINNADWANGVCYEQHLTKGAEEQSRNITIPSGQDKIKLFYYTSGHGKKDEFLTRDNVIYIDGQEIYRYEPWRTDCEKFEKQNPYSGYWNEDGERVYSYELSRSGWCPGDKVKPVVLDVTDKLSPGEHTIRFAVENIAANTGYWRVSSYLSGKGNVKNWEPEKIKVVSSANEKIVIPGTAVSVRLDIVDKFDNIIPMTDKSFKVNSDSSCAKFSLDQETWKDSLNIEVDHGSALIWIKSDKEGKIPINISDINQENSISNPDKIMINYSRPDLDNKKNFALNATATADDETNSDESASHAIDGSLETKWCCNNGAPNWLKVEFQDSIALNYFSIFHAGASQAPEGYPGHADNSSMNTQSYKIQRKKNGQWQNLITVKDNPTTEAGNISYHKLDQTVLTKTIRLYTTKPSISRIYEFKMYNLDSTNTNAINNDCGNCSSSSKKFNLLANYPNPFNSNTNIKFFIPNYGKVNISVFNIKGSKIKTIMRGKLRKGTHKFSWNGKNDLNRYASSGVYFVSIKYTNGLNKINKHIVERITYLK